jgi:predicted acyltransferase
MAGAIFVLSVGSPDYPIWPTEVSSWIGLSTADLVFPCFLFIQGV